ncbi:MAG: hypothetical protein M1836_003371 [Candelina mexicana]|nr:MAG: hypothetical protein M1836_003371 [Candelina mexicana]
MSFLPFVIFNTTIWFLLFCSITPTTSAPLETSLAPQAHHLFKRYPLMTCPHNHRTMRLTYPPTWDVSDFTNLDMLCKSAGCYCTYFPPRARVECMRETAGFAAGRHDPRLYDAFKDLCMTPGMCWCQDLDTSFAFEKYLENHKPWFPLQPVVGEAQSGPGGHQAACLAGPGDGWCIPEANGCCDEYTCMPHHSRTLSLQFGIKDAADWIYGSCLSDSSVVA